MFGQELRRMLAPGGTYAEPASPAGAPDIVLRYDDLFHGWTATTSTLTGHVRAAGRTPEMAVRALMWLLDEHESATD